MHSCARLRLLLGALQLGLVAGVTITQWSITQYNIEYLTTSVATYRTGLTYTDTSTYRLYAPVSSSLIPTASATSSSVSSDASYNAVYKTLYIPGSAVNPTLLSSISSYVSGSRLANGDSTYTNWVVNRTYTAPSSCSSSFQVTTTSSIYVPLGAATQLPSPTSTKISLGAVNTYLTAYLGSDVVLPTPISTSLDFVERYYLQSCSSPYGSSATRTSAPYSGGGSYSGGSSRSYYDDDSNCLGKLCPFWLIYIVVIIPFLGLLFLGGIIESYFWFSRLMKGKFALRGVPLL